MINIENYIENIKTKFPQIGNVQSWEIIDNLENTLSALNVITYTWNTSITNTSIVVSPIVTTAYSLQGTNSLGCVSSTSITVYGSVGVPLFTIAVTSNSVCLGNTAALTASGAITYTWINGISNGVAFTPTATANYTVFGTNACGTKSFVQPVTVAPLPMSRPKKTLQI